VAILTSSAYVNSVESLDKIARDLAEADVVAIGDAVRRVRAAKLKAWAYVWVAAVMEQYVKGILGVVLTELSALGLQRDQLNVSLLSMCSRKEFDALKDLAKLTKWKRRIQVLSAVVDHAPAVFDPSILPLDGKTIRPHHFDLVWEVFGFQGPSIPSQLHRAALIDIAEGRTLLHMGGLTQSHLVVRSSTPI
jgi:hypothetical protein